MKFSREIEHATHAAIKKHLAGQAIDHTEEGKALQIIEIRKDRYHQDPCLILKLSDGNEVMVMASFLEN